MHLLLLCNGFGLIVFLFLFFFSALVLLWSTSRASVAVMPVEYYDDDEATEDEVGDSVSGFMLLVCFEVFMLLGLRSMGFQFTS